MRLISFLQRQYNQIQKWGWVIFWQKIYRLQNRLVLKAIAQIAARLKINWPDAYSFVADKYMRKYRKMYMYPKSEKLLRRTMEKAKVYLEKYIGYKPRINKLSDWIRANANLGFIFFNEGNFQEHIGIFNQVEKIRRAILNSYQLDLLNIEFIPITIATGSIGIYENLDTYIKAEMLRLRPKKKLILLLNPEATVNNRCYLNYWSRYITVISDPKLNHLLSPLAQHLTVPICYSMSFYKKIWISHIALGIVQEQWDREKRLPLLTLSDEDYKRGWERLKSIGLPKDAWFVCLHVRESGWHDYDSSADDYRNTDINTYLPAIKSITAAGGWVVRMGDLTMRPLPGMTRVIDYALSDAKSDWMDVFLCAQCRFIIGTSSGLFTIASAFGVPAVITNFLPAYAMYSLSCKDLFIPKLCWSRDKNQYLTFQELLSPPAGIATASYSYDRLNLNPVKNTPEEIKEVVEEMLDRFNGKLHYNSKEEFLQERFKAMAAECGKEYGDENIRLNARIGKEFLRKYSFLLAQDEKIVQSC